MVNFTCQFAKINVGIEAIFEETKIFCLDYLTEEAPDFCVSVNWEDIKKEREFSDKTSLKEFGKIIFYEDSYLETLAVYRKIAEKMLDYDTLLFHGSAIAVDDQAYLFTAKSGTGKSTHTRLWRKQFGEKTYMVNDDKPLIRITDESVLVCGTPWDGKHHLSKNVIVPLKAICWLKRDEENHIEALAAKDAFPVVMQQIYYTKDVQRMEKTLFLIDKLLKQVHFYQLGCNMEPEAAMVSYQGMQEQD